MLEWDKIRLFVTLNRAKRCAAHRFYWRCIRIIFPTKAGAKRFKRITVRRWTHGGVELFGIDPLNARSFFPIQKKSKRKKNNSTKANKTTKNRNTLFLLQTNRKSNEYFIFNIKISWWFWTFRTNIKWTKMSQHLNVNIAKIEILNRPFIVYKSNNDNAIYWSYSLYSRD